MIKKIAIAVVAVIIVAAVGLYFLYSNLGSIVKAAIEKYGSQATQAQVTVDSVKLSASDGQGTISGLVVGNPAGFSSAHAFELGSISMTVDITTLTKDPVVIKQIVISAPRVTYEQGAGGSNLQKLQDNVAQFAGSSKSGGADKSERKIVISDLTIRDGQVSVVAPVLKDRTLSAPLPTIHMTDIGKGGGATPAEVAQRVVGAISSEAAKVGVSTLQKSLGNLPGAVQQQMQDAAPGVGGQLKGLLGK